MISDLALHPHSPAADRLVIRPQPAVPKPGAKKYSGHFLSIIAFDGNITMETFDSVFGAQTRRQLWRGWKLFAGSGQGRSRNECAHGFLHETDCEFHFLCDADIRFNAEHVLALRRHPEAKDSIICGAYPKKQDNIEFCLNSLKDGPDEPNKLGLIEVAKGGTGFMQIPRSVYERIRAAYPDLEYLCDYDKTPDGARVKKTAFFLEKVMHDPDVGWVRHLTEDWMFCHLARSIGIKIFVDFSTTAQPWLQHRGAVLYPLPTEIERGRVQGELDLATAKLAELTRENATLREKLLAYGDQPTG